MFFLYILFIITKHDTKIVTLSYTPLSNIILSSFSFFILFPLSSSLISRNIICHANIFTYLLMVDIVFMNPKASLFNFTPTPTHPSSLCICNNLLRTHVMDLKLVNYNATFTVKFCIISLF